MQKTKIEWTDFSWNPITGCLHGCWYCYANRLFTRFHRSFEPTFHPERLKDPYHRKTPSKIFVCSVADLFAWWTPREWRKIVMQTIMLCPIKHTFQLLTKNPERIWKGFHFPENVWVGTTVTTENGDIRNIEAIKKVNASVRFVSFEPLLGDPFGFGKETCLSGFKGTPCFEGIQWVIIGKLTGSKRVKLKDDWVYKILEEAAAHEIPVFLKDNLGWIKSKDGKESPFREFPK